MRNRVQKRHWCQMLAPATCSAFLVPAVTSSEETTKPPSALLGKSVIRSWEETRIERKVGAPSFRTVRGKSPLPSGLTDVSSVATNSSQMLERFR